MEMHEAKKKREEFIELRGLHEYSLDKCSKILEVSKPTLIKWEKNNAGSILKLKKANINATVDSLEVSVIHRLKKLKTLSQNLLGEIQERELKDIPTEKLFRLYLEYGDNIEKLINTHGFSKNERDICSYEDIKLF